jgi:predicted LPLAT superfamily acyltransferase
MSFENTYFTGRREKEREADTFLDRLMPATPRRTPLETAYELMDAAIFHILHPADTRTRNRLARSAFHALLLNRDLDHVPAYAGKLCDYLDVVDEGRVLELAAQGKQFLFAGFHTGPYWSVFQTLVRNGLHVATLFPGTLEAKRQEIADVFAAATAHYASTSTLDLISLVDPNFLLRLRSSMGDGRQLVVFLDGNSGLPAQRNEKRDVELDFFHSRITVKTTTLRLADILGLPVVTFNAVRNDIRRTLWLDPPLPKGEKKQYDEVVRTVFGRLCARLEQEPAQWEGWLYFHTYFSPAYRASLDSAGGWPPLEKRERFFIQETNDDTLLVDKQTYKQYRVHKKEGAHA